MVSFPFSRAYRTHFSWGALLAGKAGYLSGTSLSAEDDSIPSRFPNARERFFGTFS
jgi:hypothetical protein